MGRSKLGQMLSSLKNTRSALALAASVLLLGLAGCATAPAITPTASQTPTETAPPEPVYLTGPLNGVRYLEGSNPNLSNPAFSAKIDNVGAALPQYGLNSTDIVFVEQVEGGLTRLAAVWHSNLLAEVGPVRSVRPMDPDILAPIGGVIAYSGGQYAFKQAMIATGMYNADEDSEYESGNYFRKEGRSMPHDLFFKSQAIVAAQLALGAPTLQFQYADLAAGEESSAQQYGRPALSVEVKYKGSTSFWQPGTASIKVQDGIASDTAAVTEVWLRSQNGDAHFDEQDGQQIRAVNLVVLDVTIDKSFKDPRYGYIPRTVMITESSSGIYCSAGLCMPIKWSKASQAAPIVMTTMTGLPIKLAPGNTWFELRDIETAILTVENPAPPSPSPTASPSATD